MDELTKRLENLSPAKRALLERRLVAERGESPRQPQLSSPSRREPSRASFAQERLWFVQQLEPESGAYNVPRAIRIHGPLELEILEQSLNEIIRRHESLRTNFELIDGNLRQIVRESSPLTLPLVDLSSLSTEE